MSFIRVKPIPALRRDPGNEIQRSSVVFFQLAANFILLISSLILLTAKLQLILHISISSQSINPRSYLQLIDEIILVSRYLSFHDFSYN